MGYTIELHKVFQVGYIGYSKRAAESTVSLQFIKKGSEVYHW